MKRGSLIHIQNNVMVLKNEVMVDKELKDNDVLRRYLDIPRFISFLKTKSLYFYRSDLFLDKFEGSFTLTIKEAICNAYKKNEIEYTYDKFKKELREGVFLNCWSLGVDDNMALWKLYGKTDNCVVITTTVAKLKTVLNEFRGPDQLFLSKVEYVRYWKNPEIKVNPYPRVFRYKPVGYAFENEVRVILNRFESTFKADLKEEGVMVSVDLKTLLRSIVLSPECSPWFRDVIKDIVNKYGISCPIRDSVMSKSPI